MDKLEYMSNLYVDKKDREYTVQWFEVYKQNEDIFYIVFKKRKHFIKTTLGPGTKFLGNIEFEQAVRVDDPTYWVEYLDEEYVESKRIQEQFNNIYKAVDGGQRRLKNWRKRKGSNRTMLINKRDFVKKIQSVQTLLNKFAD